MCPGHSRWQYAQLRAGDLRYTIGCTTWRCSSTRAGLWIRPRRWVGLELREYFADGRRLLEARLRKQAVREYIGGLVPVGDLCAVRSHSSRRRRRAVLKHHQLRCHTHLVICGIEWRAAPAGLGQPAASARANVPAHHAGRGLPALIRSHSCAASKTSLTLPAFVLALSGWQQEVYRSGSRFYHYPCQLHNVQRSSDLQ